MAGKQSKKSSKQADNVNEQSGNSGQIVQRPILIKSPSDMTIYSPGLRKVSNYDDISIIEKISNFVESIRLDGRNQQVTATSRYTSPSDTRRVEKKSGNLSKPGSAARNSNIGMNASTVSDQPQPRTSSQTHESPQNDRAAEQLLLQAKKFKARVEAPRGNSNTTTNFHSLLMPYDYDKPCDKFVKPEGLGPIDSEILFLHNFDQDDEFFHITSQIEPGLRSKIERGEYVELERLLPKDRTIGKNDDLNKQLFQLITQGTNTYLEPPSQKAGKINSIRKWDQAFRGYAAIYTNANPERASEIWQYVYVIHTAAGANPWDNVYFYDINFRELMASKPWRSWGKTYTQDWNMAFNNSHHLTNPNTNNGQANSFNNNHNSSNNRTKDWKDDCCWHYNKNRCKRSSAECNYDHRCTYCTGWNHSFFNCKKRQNKQRKFLQGGGNANKSGGSSPGRKRKD